MTYKGLAVKKSIMLALLLCAHLLNVAHADTVKSLVRISCVPETGLLDIEYRYLHDSVAGDPTGQDKRKPALAQAGFHDPRGLAFSCALGATTYLITAEQDPESNKMCGADPEVYLTVTRAGEKMVSHVVLGDSCNQLPSATRVTIGDGPNSWRGRETQVCYATGKRGDAEYCDWTFGAAAQFDRRFPIDQARVQKIVSKQEHR